MFKADSKPYQRTDLALDLELCLLLLPVYFAQERAYSLQASHILCIAARDNQSATVEVRMRPTTGQWRYHLDVIVDGKFFYFDRYPQKIQIFKG